MTSLLFNIPIGLSNDYDYGEDSECLGQIIEDYTNDNTVNITYQVIHNSTLSCMELNYTEGIEVIRDWTDTGYENTSVVFAEHDRWSSDLRFQTFTILADALSIAPYTTINRGHLWIMLTINSDWLDQQYVRFRWMKYRSGSTGGVDNTFPIFRVYDGLYDRASDTDFPHEAEVLEKGSGGKMYEATMVGLAYNTWQTKDVKMDITSWGGNQTYTTLMWSPNDYSTVYLCGIQIDWIQVNEGSGGADNQYYLNWNSGIQTIVWEEGSDHTNDNGYGFFNGTLGIGSGGYDGEGYFTTTEMLNGNKTIVAMYNTSIPDDASMSVEYSIDNETTWVNSKNIEGSEIITNGYHSVDLRHLNTSIIWQKVSMTGDGLVTPRLYQTRFITTEGNCTGGNGEVENNIYGILIAIFLLCIGFILLYGVKRK